MPVSWYSMCHKCKTLFLWYYQLSLSWWPYFSTPAQCYLLCPSFLAHVFCWSVFEINVYTAWKQSMEFMPHNVHPGHHGHPTSLAVIGSRLVKCYWKNIPVAGGLDVKSVHTLQQPVAKWRQQRHQKWKFPTISSSAQKAAFFVIWPWVESKYKKWLWEIYTLTFSWLPWFASADS